jgi:hypothetical protein
MDRQSEELKDQHDKINELQKQLETTKKLLNQKNGNINTESIDRRLNTTERIAKDADRRSTTTNIDIENMVRKQEEIQKDTRRNETIMDELNKDIEMLKMLGEKGIALNDQVEKPK